MDIGKGVDATLSALMTRLDHVTHLSTLMYEGASKRYCKNEVTTDQPLLTTYSQCDLPICQGSRANNEATMYSP